MRAAYCMGSSSYNFVRGLEFQSFVLTVNATLIPTLHSVCSTLGYTGAPAA